MLFVCKSLIKWLKMCIFVLEKQDGELKNIHLMKSFKIRSYGRTELAQIYCPSMSSQSAYRKLSHWIDLYPGLRRELDVLGTSSKSRSYTPAQVRLIVEALGEPGE
jgi:hypothetical protein